MKTYKTEKELYHAVLEAALLDGTAVKERIDRELRSSPDAPHALPRARRAVFVLAAVLLLIASAALAAGFLLRGQGSRIPFFSRGVTSIEHAQTGWQERNSDEVLTVLPDANKEASLVIENIAFHEDELTIFFSFPEGDTPSLWIRVNGGERIRGARQGSVVRTKDGRSAGSISFYVFPKIPDECALTVGAEAPYDAAVQTFRVDLNKRRSDARITFPGASIALPGTGDDPQTAPDGTEYYGPYYDHTVTVESVTVDRDGGRILLSEETPGEGPYADETFAAWTGAMDAAKEDFFREHPDLTEADWTPRAEAWLAANPCPLTPEEIGALWEAYDETHPVSFVPFVNFAVLDENGASLQPWIPGISGGSRSGRTENTILFTPSEGLRSVTIVPLYYMGKEASLTLPRSGETAHADSCDLSARILSFEADTERGTVTVSFRMNGVRLLDAWAGCLVDRSGDRLAWSLESDETPFFDPASGILTQEFRVREARWNPEEIGGYALTLFVPYRNDAEAVTIPLP